MKNKFKMPAREECTAYKVINQNPEFFFPPSTLWKTPIQCKKPSKILDKGFLKDMKWDFPFQSLSFLFEVFI